jgi:hypothetical protein
VYSAYEHSTRFSATLGREAINGLRENMNAGFIRETVQHQTNSVRPEPLAKNLRHHAETFRVA